MQNEKSRKARAWLIKALVFVVLVAIVWVCAGVVMGTEAEKVEQPSLGSTFKDIAKVLKKASITLPIQMRIKAIKEEAEVKAQEYATWVSNLEEQAETQVVAGGGGGYGEDDYGQDVVPGYHFGDDPEIDMMILEHKKWSWIITQLEILKKEEDRKAMAIRIDAYLSNRGSPMTGLGYAFVVEAEKYGIDPRLGVAIAEAESTCGKACFAPHNAWGMLGYPSGWSSWEEGIAEHFAYLNRHFGSPQSAYDCPGYCEPNHPWMENVDGVRCSI